MKKKTPKQKDDYSFFSNVNFMLKSILNFDKSLLFFMPFPMVAQVGISVIGIYLPKLIIDMLAQETSLNQLLITIIWVCFALMVFQIMLRLSNNQIVGRSTGNRVAFNIPITEKTLYCDYETIAHTKGQEMRRKAINSVISDDQGLQSIVRHTVNFLKNSVGFVVFSIILFSLNPYIVLVLILGAVINLFVAKHAISYEHKHKKDYVPIDNKIVYMRERTIENKCAKDVRLYSMATWLMNIYDGFINKRYDWEMKIEMHRFIPNVVDAVIVIVRDGLAYAYLIYRVFNGLSVGDFMLYFGAITGFSIWLSALGDNINELKRASLHISDLRGFLDIKEKTNRGKGCPLPTIDEMPCSIELKNVCYKYPGSDEYAVKDVNLYIQKGEKLAIVGENGAGKTTIVKLICGLILPSSGEILLNGIAFNEYNLEEYQSLFAVAFQDACIPSFSIAEIVALAPLEDVDNGKLNDAIKLADLQGKVDTLKDGTSTYVNNIFSDEGIELSGGEQQKLILARALYKDSPVLILDEPTAALDPIAELKLYNQYKEMSQNKTSVYISHRLSSTRFCDNIIFVDNGQITEKGTHDELMENEGRYAYMFDVQSHYYKNDVEVQR